jgi:uncharacterized protein YneF (UPF0154 family)
MNIYIEILLIIILAINCFIAGTFYEANDWSDFKPHLFILLLIIFVLFGVLIHFANFSHSIYVFIKEQTNIIFWYKFYTGEYKNMDIKRLEIINERAVTIYKNDKSFVKGVALINKQNNYTPKNTSHE